MPVKASKPCGQPGCSALVKDGRFCARHKKEYQQRQDQCRGSAAARGYDNRWRKYREQYLKRHPLCVKCLEEGGTVPAIVVDHIIPHKGNRALFWDTSNHQALCKKCHDIKTAKEDGGFGNG